MAVTVGIPRVLTYYKYHAMWRAFLVGVGARIVISPQSNRAMVNRGVELSENELCVPVKLAFGHVAWLADRCDVLFVPRIVSVRRREYTCPKFLGLPDMIAACGLDLPPMLAPTVDLRRSGRGLGRAMREVGRALGADDLAVRRARRVALAALASHEEEMRQGLTPIDIEDGLAGTSELPDAGPDALTVGIVGHPYNLYDRHVSMNLVRRLRQKGVVVHSPEMLDPRVIQREARTLPKVLFWTYENEVVGAALHWARHGGVDGLIYMLSFACGPDSLVQVLLEHEIRRYTDTPLLTLVIDEHSAEAGLLTRLEAFLDMLRWQRGQAA